MRYDNVIPIDAEVAQLLARRQTRFRWFVAALTVAWVAVLVPTLLFTPLPPLGPFIALAVLVVLAEHRFVLFGDETSMSASIIVVIASVFVFADTSPVAGPMLIASLGGLYVPHLQRREWSKTAFNGAGMGVASLVAAAAAYTAASAVPVSRSGLLLTVACSLSTYWVANNLLVAAYQKTRYGASFFATAKCFLTSETDILPWAGASCIGASAAGGTNLAACAFVAAVVALRVTTPRIKRVFNTHVGRSRSGGARLDSLVIWLAALAIITTRGAPNPIELGTAITIALLLPRYPANPSRLLAAWLPILAIASMFASPLTVAVVFAASVATIVLTPKVASTWSACIAFGATAWTLVTRSGLGVSFESRSSTAVVLAIIGPAAFALLVHATRTVCIAQHHDIRAAIGLVAPSVKDMLGVAVAVAAVLACDVKPVLVLTACTTIFAARSWQPINGQKSLARASR